MEDLGIEDSTLGALQVSIFLFAYAVGPLFLAPLSERYGRAIILHLGNVVFVAFSIGGGFAQTVGINKTLDAASNMRYELTKLHSLHN
jgi:MFS family permease